MIRKKVLPVLPWICLTLVPAPADIEWESGDQGMDQTRITIAQVRAVPEKGKLEANHQVLMQILGEIEKHPGVDVAITPEYFLDGYIATEEEVTPKDMARYSVDPANSPYVRAAAEWAGRNRCWLIYGCARREGERVFNSALIIALTRLRSAGVRRRSGSSSAPAEARRTPLRPGTSRDAAQRRAVQRRRRTRNLYAVCVDTQVA